jgi:tetratricopeptide (TPR) repeat protein
MRRLGVAALLAAAVLLVYWPVVGFDFVNFDDDKYVTANPWVQRGLDAASFRWAWTTLALANWHPLTWLSHMLDWQLFGPAAGGHHATSLALHVANTILCFVVFERLTGALWRSALVAALFGIHPLHVESVAWVSERKDVLSTCFWFLGMGAYVAYVHRPRWTRLGLVLSALAAGLASKPMLVTFPAVLLLLDWWPLGRLRTTTALRMVGEKLPLFALVAASSVLTVVSQSRGGAVGSLSRYPLAVRVENALASWVGYLRKTVWPVDLSVFYPHPEAALPVVQVVVATLVLIAVTTLAIRVRHRRPHVLVGWLWYLGTLVPVIGIVQVGAHAMADRFTYIPLIGIFVMLAWSLPSGRAAQGLVAAALVVLALRAHAQVAVWKDSVTLFEHALAVNPRNGLAHLNLGIALTDRGELDRAIAHLEESQRIRPGQAEVENALGNAWLDRNQPDRAEAHFAAAIHMAPDYAMALTNLGYVLTRTGRPGEAIPLHEHALRVDPTLASAENHLGIALSRTGNAAPALQHFARAVELDARNADAQNNLGATLIAAGRATEGVPRIEAALALRPDFGRAYANYAMGLAALGRNPEAWAAVRRARELGVEVPESILAALRARSPEPSGR